MARGSIRHRWVEAVSAATDNAPSELRRRVATLRQIATDRNLLLFECALLRQAPFALNGQSIWHLLSDFEWFTLWKNSAPSEKLNGHEAIEVLERMADNAASPAEIADAKGYCHWSEYKAEADRFGYDAEKAIGSELRYGVADWLLQFENEQHDRRNVLDYYLTAYTGHYYAWGNYQPLHDAHRDVALALIGDIFGDPFQPVTFAAEWRTETAVLLAQQMYESRDFSAMPILADALQDAGCVNPDILSHCRDVNQVHVRGCWAVDLVLGKS